jgi:hypothetical protein
MKHPEQDLQRSVAQYLDTVLARHVVWSAIPSGGGGAIRGAQLKAMGLKRGLGDIYLSWQAVAHGIAGPTVVCYTAWLELKSNRGVQSKEQKDFQVRVQGLGHAYCVCKSVDDVSVALKILSIPTRETKR